MKFRVRQGCAVIATDNKTLLRGGSMLDEVIIAKAGKQWIEDQIKQGYIEAVNVEQQLADDLVESPLTEQPTPLKTEVDLGAEQENPEVITLNSEPDPVAHHREVDQAESIWVLDPSGLQDKGLDELNAMIIERDDTIEPMETAEEAIAQLSADFE